MSDPHGESSRAEAKFGITQNYGAAGTFNAPVTVNGRPPVRWPHQVGIVPPLVDCRQDRPADHNLAAFTSLEAADDSAQAAVVPCLVLSGLGGVGKTQVAAVLAHRAWAQQQVDLLVWVTAASRAAIQTAYAIAAADITGVKDQDEEQGARRFVAWLSNGSKMRWLIVLDDVQIPSDLNGLWPPDVPIGRTVVTTRRRDTALTAGRQLVNIGLFTPDQSLVYLGSKLSDESDLLVEAPQLAEDLGHLPLAMAQAATYMLDRGLSCSTYRQRFADRRRRLVDLAPGPGDLPDEHQRTIATTWSLSIETANSLSPIGVARPILELLALLAPDSIPVILFTASAVIEVCGGRASRQVSRDDIHDAVRLLQRFNLAAIDDVMSNVTVHGLVQRAVREATDPDYMQLLAGGAVEALIHMYETNWVLYQTNWEAVMLFRSHFRALLVTARPHLVNALASIDPTTAAGLMFMTGWDETEGLRAQMDPEVASRIDWAMILLPESGGGP